MTQGNPVGGFETWSAEQVRARLAEPDECTVLDVRTPNEHRMGHIPGSHLLPLLSASGCLTQSPTPETQAQLAQAGLGQVQLRWAANPGEQDGFSLEQSSDGSEFAEIQKVPDPTTRFLVTGLAPGKTYAFRIRGYNSLGNSPYAKTLSVTIPPKGGDHP